MSTLPFNFVVDWIMRRTTKDQFRGIRWKPFSYLKDLDLHLCKASWPQHQQQEDRNYGAEYYQHTTQSRFVNEWTSLFDVICDLLLNRHTATWNLFVLYNKELKYSLGICRVEGSLKARVFFSKYCPLIANCIIFRVYTTVIYLKWEEYKLRILKIGWFLKTVWMKPQTLI